MISIYKTSGLENSLTLRIKIQCQNKMLNPRFYCVIQCSCGVQLKCLNWAKTRRVAETVETEQIS
jgi:hypothetical protein